MGFEYGLCGKCLSRYDIAIGGGWVGWMGDEGDFSGDDIGGFCMGIGRGQIAARASGFVVDGKSEALLIGRSGVNEIGEGGGAIGRLQSCRAR